MRRPGTGDLFFGGQWHTWLVGGLGVGGAAIYALDVTNPSASNFTEGNAASIVIGEWNAGHHRLHQRRAAAAPIWATPSARRKSAVCTTATGRVIFGNGFGSASGDAGSTSCPSTARRARKRSTTSAPIPRGRQRHRLRDAGRFGWRSHHRLRLCGRPQRQCVAVRSDQQ